MNFQYYETLKEKSEKNLFDLVEKIVPEFTKGELKIYLDDIAKIPIKNQKSSGSNSIKGFVDIGEDYETVADLSILKQDQLESMYKYFISREINDRLAVKWRFYQFLKYIPNLMIENIKINRTADPENAIDLLIEEPEGNIILVLCFDKLDIELYSEGINKLIEFVHSSNIIPNRVIYAVNKTYRNIPIEKSISIDDTSINLELWVEWIDQDSMFNGEDLIIVNNNELELAGFNFISTQDLLDYVYELSEEEQISIYRQPGYFSEIQENVQEIELVWKGIMVKKKEIS